MLEVQSLNRTVVIISLFFLVSLLFIWYGATPPTKKIEKEILKVGLNAEYPPFAFIQDGKPIGFDVDLIREIGTRLNQDVDIKNMPFGALVPGIQLGELDVVISGITPTPQRAKQILFTEPYLKQDPLVILSLSSKPKLKTVDDLKDKRIVVNEGFNADFYISKIPGPVVTRLETIDQAFLELLSGRSDAFVTALKPLQPLFKKHPKDMFHVVTIPETEDTYAIGITKKRSDLLEKIQAILDTMQEDGTFQHLLQKWNFG